MALDTPEPVSSGHAWCTPDATTIFSFLMVTVLKAQA